MENSLVVLQNIKQCYHASTVLGIYPREVKICINTKAYKNVPRNIIHNSKKKKKRKQPNVYQRINRLKNKYPTVSPLHMNLQAVNFQR